MGVEGRSGGARLRASLELQVPREPGMLAFAHGRVVWPPSVVVWAVGVFPGVAPLLIPLLRFGVEFCFPFVHEAVAVRVREDVAALDRHRSTIAQAPGVHEVLPPLQEVFDHFHSFFGGRRVLPRVAIPGHGLLLEKNFGELLLHVGRDVVVLLHCPKVVVELCDVVVLYRRTRRHRVRRLRVPISRRRAIFRSIACGRSVGSGGLFGPEGLRRGRGRRGTIARAGLLRGRRRNGRLRSSACGRSVGSGGFLGHDGVLRGRGRLRSIPCCGVFRGRRRHGSLRSIACGMSVGSGGLDGLQGLVRVRGWPRRIACRRRHGRLRSSACASPGAFGAVSADGDHQLRRHDVVLVVAHAAVVGKGLPNGDCEFFPEGPEDEHHVAGELRVRGEDLAL